MECVNISKCDLTGRISIGQVSQGIPLEKTGSQRRIISILLILAFSMGRALHFCLHTQMTDTSNKTEFIMQEEENIQQKGWKNHSLAEGKFSPEALCTNSVENSDPLSFLQKLPSYQYQFISSCYKLSQHPVCFAYNTVYLNCLCVHVSFHFHLFIQQTLLEHHPCFKGLCQISCLM